MECNSEFNHDVEKIANIILQMQNKVENEIRGYENINDPRRKYLIGKSEGLFYAYTLLTNKFNM